MLYSYIGYGSKGPESQFALPWVKFRKNKNYNK